MVCSTCNPPIGWTMTVPLAEDEEIATLRSEVAALRAERDGLVTRLDAAREDEAAAARRALAAEAECEALRSGVEYLKGLCGAVELPNGRFRYCEPSEMAERVRAAEAEVAALKEVWRYTDKCHTEALFRVKACMGLCTCDNEQGCDIHDPPGAKP